MKKFADFLQLQAQKDLELNQSMKQVETSHHHC
jgi:hypothetical protein